MRYVGQVHECTVEIGNFDNNAKAIDRIKDAFHQRHEELYTYSERHNAVEVVNIEARSTASSTSRSCLLCERARQLQDTLKEHRKAIFSASGKGVRTPVYDGSALGAGAVIEGPAIIEEVTTTIVIEPDWVAKLHSSGSYVITRKTSVKH